MTSIYIDYPMREFCIRTGVSSAERFRHDKPNRRVVRLTSETFSQEIKPFLDRQVAFAASAELNDLWLDLHFGDEEFEKSVGLFVKRILGQRYRPIAEAQIR
jgi:hypothetical protein